MSNYAALIGPLVISGSRKSDGSPNATGLCWFYIPGSLTPLVVYADAAAETVVSAPLALDDGGRVPYDTYPAGLYTTQPVRLYIEDINGAVVSDTVFVPASAGNVGVNNEAFPDSTTLDEVLTLAGESFGGTNFLYKESGGATERPVQDKFREYGISVTDFGAVGNGIADDTTAIQTAINRVTVLGGGTVYFPPGTYKTSQALTLTNALGVHLVGAGRDSTIIVATNAVANMFTCTTCSDTLFEDIKPIHSLSSTGAIVAMAGCVMSRFIRFGSLEQPQSSVGYFRYGVTLTACSRSAFYDANLTTLAGDADARGLLVFDSSFTTAFGGSFGGTAGYTIEFVGTTGNVQMFGVAGAANALFNSVLSGKLFTFYGCGLSSAASVPTVNTATDPDIRIFGSSYDGRALSFATGTTQTPDRSTFGSPLTLFAETGGAGTVTVNAPTKPPGPNALGVYLTLVFRNGAFAVTWTLDPAYKVTAAIPTTAGHTTIVTFLWDLVGVTNTWREVSRSDTVT